MKLILDERGKKYILKEGQEFESDLGIISAEVLSDAQYGDEVKSHLDHSFKIVKPNINDFIDVMERRCSILIKKDIGMVLAYTGLGAGSRVVDAGTGAGAIALNFANVVGETGHVYTYEIREDFAEVAKRNIDTFGIKNIDVKNQNVKDGIEEDKKIRNTIIKKLSELDEAGQPLIDMVIVVFDASSKDLGTYYSLINEVLIPCFGEEANQRILLALNQSDVAMKGNHWDEENNMPDSVLQDYLNKKAMSIQTRIKKATGIDARPICYCAGYKEENGEKIRKGNFIGKKYLFRNHTRNH